MRSNRLQSLIAEWSGNEEVYAFVTPENSCTAVLLYQRIELCRFGRHGGVSGGLRMYNLENGLLPFDVTMTRTPHGSHTTP